MSLAAKRFSAAKADIQTPGQDRRALLPVWPQGPMYPDTGCNYPQSRRRKPIRGRDGASLFSAPAAKRTPFGAPFFSKWHVFRLSVHAFACTSTSNGFPREKATDRTVQECVAFLNMERPHRRFRECLIQTFPKEQQTRGPAVQRHL